jgi:hypothetical protein
MTVNEKYMIRTIVTFDDGSVLRLNLRLGAGLLTMAELGTVAVWGSICDSLLLLSIMIVEKGTH